MAGTVNEEYSWRPTVKVGASARQNAKIMVWDADDAVKVNGLTTDANGQIAQQWLQKAIHSITGTDTVSTDDKTPHTIRTIYIGDTDLGGGKYACEIDEFSLNVVQAGVNTIFLDIDQFVTHTKTVIDAYTGFTFNHGSDLLTVATNHTLNEVYEAIVAEAYDSPQQTPTRIMYTVDGVTFFMLYDFTINGVTLTADEKTISLGTDSSSPILTFSGVGDFSGSLSVDGNVVWGTNTTIGSSGNGLTVTGEFDFTTADTYTMTDCVIDEVTNSSGGSVTINAVNCTITTNTGPNITINNSVPVKVTVLDAITKSALQGARVYLEEDDSAAAEIINELTDSSGEAETTFNYTSDQDIVGRVRLSSSSPYYKTSDITGTIGTAGFDITVLMIKDE